MGDLPFFLFQSKSNKKNYVVLLFWAADDTVSRILEKVQTTVYPTTNFRSILRSKV